MTTRELRAARAAPAGQTALPPSAGQVAATASCEPYRQASAFPKETPDPLAARLLLTPAETCVILSIKKTTLYKWLGEGLLRSRKIGGKRLIQADSVRELSSRCHDGLEPGQH